jgi:hypothetical protein
MKKRNITVNKAMKKKTTSTLTRVGIEQHALIKQRAELSKQTMVEILNEMIDLAFYKISPPGETNGESKTSF